MNSIFDDISNAFKKSNNASVQLILVCFIFFAFKTVLSFIAGFFPNSDVSQLFIQQNLIVNTDWKQLITHPWTVLFFPFSTNGVLNLIFGMIALFWFASLLTDFLGSRKTIAIYYSGAIFSLILFLSVNALVSKLGAKPTQNIYLFGSSAGMYSVLFAAVALLPAYEFSFFRMFIKLKYVALAFLIFSFLSPVHGLLNLGGAIFGYLQIKFLRAGWNFIAPFLGFVTWLTSLNKPKKVGNTKKLFKVNSGANQNNFESQAGYPNQEEVDYLLDKISINGYDSLSKTEKERLYEASQKKD